MKKIYFLKNFGGIIVFLCLSIVTFSQDTYYWVGGIGPAAIGEGTNWNKNLDGTGDARSTPTESDILIFDGSNVGGGSPTTGTVQVTITGTIISQLILQNAANVILSRIGGTTGTITLNGDASDDPDLVVKSGSHLTIDSDLASGNVNIALTSFASGQVDNGCTIRIANTGTHRITSQKANGLVFKTGSTFYSDATPSSGAYPFGSSSQSVQYGVKFEKGANLIVNGNRSPMGNSSTFQTCNMEAGSNYIQRSSNPASTGSWTNLKIFGNIIVENNTAFTADGPFYKIDTLNIKSGSTLTTHTSGNTAVLGDLIVDGTLGAPAASTNVLVIGGSIPQTISGAGSISVPSFTVGNYSNVTLHKTITVGTTVNIVGMLTLGAQGKIEGTANFTSRVNQTPVNFTGNTTAGSYIVTGVAGPTGITGLFIKGDGLAGNTNVVGFSSSNSAINLSKPALTTTVGTIFSFASDTATLVFNTSMGANAIGNAGTKSFQAGTKYAVNMATDAPFGISSEAGNSMTVGTVSINAPITTNYNISFTGGLSLADGAKVTIRPTDTLRISSGTDIQGAPFGMNKYFISSVAGANAGVLRIDNITTMKLFPIGSATNYLPVWLTPSANSDFAVSVFEGITADGTPNGTAFTTDQKAKVVNSVWTINRVNGAGDAEVKLSWPSSLEGSDFMNFTNDKVGIGRYNGSAWEQVIGSGDNTTNMAMATYSEFSPFSVGELGFVLPIGFKEVSGTVKNIGVEIAWTMLNDEKGNRYAVERSEDGNKFVEIGAVQGNTLQSYSMLDNQNMFAKSFYRIRLMKQNGQLNYSNVIMVNKAAGIDITVYPNPASETLIIAGLKEQGRIRIFNAAGQQILQRNTNANSLSVDISALQRGVYFIEIVGKNSVRRTFIKR